jgi:hypothetical protein
MNVSPVYRQRTGRRVRIGLLQGKVLLIGNLMASGMERDQKSLQKRLSVITGLLIASLFSMMAVIRYWDSLSGLNGIVYMASLALFILSPIVLLWTAWRGVSVYGMAKMEAWWWLSAPYSVAYPLSMLMFQLQEFGHELAPFVLLSMLTTVSSAIWMLVAIYQLAVSRARNFTAKKKAMLALVVLAGILWATLREYTSR